MNTIENPQKQSEEWDINKLLSPEDQKELGSLQESFANLSNIIKNPWQFINNETVGETLQKLAALHKKAKEAQEKQKNQQ